MRLNLFSLAWSNMRRKLFRSVAIALAVMVVAATLFSVTTIMDSVEQSLERGTSRLGADIMVVPADAEAEARSALLAGRPSTFYMDASLVDKIRKIKGVRSVSSQTFLKTSSYSCCDISDMLLIGFDQEHDFTIMPWLTKAMGRPLKDDEVIMGRNITAYAPGFQLKFFNTTFTIAGMLEETGMDFIDNSIFIPYSGLARIHANIDKDPKTRGSLPTGKVSTILVQVSPEYAADRVGLFIEAGVDGVKAIVTDKIIASVRKQMFILLRSIISVSAILWVMALVLIGVVFSMIVNERKKEIGIFRALGSRKSYIFNLVMTEATFLSLIGGALGVAGGGAILAAFRDTINASLHVPHLWPSTGRMVVLIVFCLALSLLTGIIAALIPAIRAAVIEPYEAIRHGE